MITSTIVKLASMFQALAEQLRSPQNIKDNLREFEQLLMKRITWNDVESWLNANKNIFNVPVESLDLWRDYVFVEHKTDLRFVLSGTKEPFFVLSKNFDDLKNIDIAPIETGILNSTETIPKLFYAKFKDLNKRSYVDLKKHPNAKLSHEMFLIESINELPALSNEIINVDMIESFLIENKKNIDKIRANFEYIPKFLGKGSDAFAWDIGNGLVLKIFSNNHVINDAHKAQQRLFDNPTLARTEAMIHGYGTIGYMLDIPIHYIILEKMEPIEKSQNIKAEKDIENILMYIDYYLAEHKYVLKKIKDNIDEYDQSKLAEIIKFTTKHIVNELLSADSDLKTRLKKSLQLNENWLDLFVTEVISKYFTSRTDLHLGNLGITSNRELRYFDPSYPLHRSNLNFR